VTPFASVYVLNQSFSEKRRSMKLKIFLLLFVSLGNLLHYALLVDCYMPNPPPIARWLINWGLYTFVPADTLIRMEMFKSFVPLANSKYITVQRVTQIQIGMVVLYTAGVIGHFAALGYLYSEQPSGLTTFITASIYMIFGPIYEIYNAVQIVYIAHLLFVAIDKVKQFKAQQGSFQSKFASRMISATHSVKINKSNAPSPISPTPLRRLTVTSECSTKITIDANSVVLANRLVRTIFAQVVSILLALGSCMYGALAEDTLTASYVFHIGFVFG
jgi:hypothetical protein